MPGKIVVYNQDYEGYGVSVAYRSQGAARASKLGAVASLIRSVTPFSIDSPHTGMQVGSLSIMCVYITSKLIHKKYMYKNYLFPSSFM